MDGPIIIMLRLSPRLLTFAFAVPAAALLTTYLAITAAGGHAKLGGPLGLTVYLSTSALMVTIGAAVWTNRTRGQQRRQWLCDTLRSVNEAVILTNVRGSVTGMNTAAESLTGWKEAEAVGQPVGSVFRLVDANNHRPVVNPVVKALHKGVIVGPSNETLLVARDGSERCVRDVSAPIRDDRGHVFAGAVAFKLRMTRPVMA
jgi:PAS domain S-box-containing protein